MTCSTKKLILLICILFTGTECTQAQQAQVLSYNEFKSISLNNKISLSGLAEAAGNWTNLKHKLGQPVSQECIEKPILGFEPSCEFVYNGFKLNYVGVGNGTELAKANVINAQAFINYQGTDIRVGDSISKLQPLFPEAYNNRGRVTSNGVTRYFVQLNINKSVTYLVFKYSNSTKKIMKIQLFQILT